ncbi:2-C-methyl-D-erythritol 4-phosphate cytidylyltransferase [Rubripirellula amarantea]|uniref:2-C-methyl-D-erythritol 4-phosphate cytidylyltransferase n=1 Tax=Rubripirellula amarantea TaxID=2527999 RepID=A0A5C5WVL7_9BACT|nr:2-C-methyl-D-erythritol 4-phosphate cytidylyltransferase [Rubripirellula amarantea]TWT54181.1 2-C-methyl-D-erythritol 4-phosphate cytidylyltransferase [Rubripirellula amarantea]
MSEAQAPSMNVGSPDAPSVAVIIPAAGSGQRFGATTNKLFALLDGQPLWLHSVRRLRQNPMVGSIVMAVSDQDRVHFENDHAADLRTYEVQLVRGGTERSDSVQSALGYLADAKERLVAVHDAARPLIRQRDLDAVFTAANQTGAAILTVPVSGTVRRDLGERTETVDRRHLHIALTPQVFEAGLLRSAYAKHNGRPATDDAELVERCGHPVTLVCGGTDNLKITYPEDLIVAEAILRSQLAQDA